MRIGVDVMGGDLGPAEVIAGAREACELIGPDDRIVLVGDRAIIEGCLAEVDDVDSRLEIHHAEQTIGMAESPVEALRNKPRSSISQMAELHRAGELDGCISSGNTGACVAAAQMRLGRLPNVARPGIAVIAPTFKGGVAICDVGANVNCRPQHLHQYAVMTSLYVNAVTGIEKPRVGLLSVGEEEGKGNDLVKSTRMLLEADPHINFIGNVESRDLVSGICDVMICEGFVGNVVLKLIEGLGAGLMKGLLGRLASIMPDQIGLIKKAAHEIKVMYDFNEYGGAPLLGIAGIWIICHGASNATGIKNAVRAVKEFASHKVNEQITQLLSEA